MLAMRVRDDTMVELPYSIRDENLIAGRTTQDLHTMIALLLGECQRRLYVRSVKQVHEACIKVPIL